MLGADVRTRPRIAAATPAVVCGVDGFDHWGWRMSGLGLDSSGAPNPRDLDAPSRAASGISAGVRRAWFATAIGFVCAISVIAAAVPVRAAALGPAAGPLARSGPSTPAPAGQVNPGSLLVAFRAPVSTAGARVRTTVAAARAAGLDPTLADRGENQVNRVLGAVRASAVRRLFTNIPGEALRAARDRAQHATGTRLIDLSQVYQVVFDPRQDTAGAVAALTSSPLVDTAMPDYRYQTPRREPSVGVPFAPVAALAPYGPAEQPAAAGLPPNYGYATDAQSYHDAASNNITGAMVQVAQRFHQQPGQGETITNLSLGTVDDSSTVVEHGQRYLEQQGFPRIPVYLSHQACAPGPDSSQNCAVTLDGNAVNTKADEGDLGEVMLDFSVLAPPPRGDGRVVNPQPPGQLGELLGAAYGANYRLVNPLTNSTPDFFASWLGSAFLQTPKPSVITASIGNGLHDGGFPDDFFESQRMIHDIVTTLVNGRDIFVAISSGDGQSAKDAAGPPNGLSGPYELAPPGMTPPDLDGSVNDPNYTYLWTNEPRYIADSGALSAGGVTLNDIFNNSPTNARISSRTRHEQATTETRWTGQQNFHSGNGPRVNVAAPADDVVFLNPVQDKEKKPVSPIAVRPELIGGTSAACPEIAAAAAVVHQVSRLTGHELNPRQIRDMLTRTGHQVTPPAADRSGLGVGVRLDETAAVDQVLADAGQRGGTQLIRMTVAQRKAVPYPSGYGRGFYSDTPQDAFAHTARIDLGQGLSEDSSNTKEEVTGSGDNLNAPITFALDVASPGQHAAFGWQLALGSRRVAVPSVDHDPSLPYLRLLPQEIFTLLGAPLTAPQDRVVEVTGSVAGQSIVERVTFAGQKQATYGHARAPVFQPLVRPHRPNLAASLLAAALGSPRPAASVVSVGYDLRGLRGVDGGELLVSDIDRAVPRAFPDTDVAAHGTPIKLPALVGTVDVPASALNGAGVYGLALRGTSHGVPQDGQNDTPNTTGPWLPLRVLSAVEATPASPKVRAVSSGFNSSGPLWWDVANSSGADGSPDFTVSYDVRAVPGARGALVEFSAPATDFYRALFPGTVKVANGNMFTNPLGDRLDHGNRLGQPGESAHRALPDTHGDARLSATDLGLPRPIEGTCDNTYQVRVFATDAHGAIIGTASYTSLLSVADLSAATCQAAKP